MFTFIYRFSLSQSAACHKPKFAPYIHVVRKPHTAAESDLAQRPAKVQHNRFNIQETLFSYFVQNPFHIGKFDSY